MDKNEIEKGLRDLLEQYIELKIPIEQITVENNLEEIGVDSISFMKVVVAIEMKYNFEFQDSDLIVDNFQTLNRLIQYIQNQLSA